MIVQVADRPFVQFWTIPGGGLSKETAPDLSREFQDIFAGPRKAHSLAKLNIAEYVSAGPHLLRVNPYNQVEQEDKVQFFETWIERISFISQPVVRIMLDFTKLEDDWDSYSAEKISLPTVLNAVNLFMRIIDLHPNAPLPFVAPAPDGSIHFEWSTLSSEFRHIVPKEESACFIYKIIDRGSGELRQHSNRVYGMEQMVNVFSQWIEGRCG